MNQDQQTAVSIRPRFLRRPDAAAYMGCSIRTLDALKHNGVLPFYHLGRRLIVYKREDLDRFMEQHRIAVGE